MQEESVFVEALEIDDPAERAAFLDRACAGDDALRCRIEQLLRRHEEADSLLDRPAGDAAAITEMPADCAGTVIGPYRLLETIGEGGMGTVYLAEQARPVRRTVALKVIKAGMDSRQVLARFEAERQALAMMDHPNIAKVLDAGTTESERPYFVMELVKGVPITEFCDRGRLTPRQRLELFIPVCQAVQHAHQKGVIHRDLKPSNVLVAVHDTTPVPKVIDFGLAKAVGQALTDKTMHTAFAQILGTPLYMSPEQASRSTLDIDTRSDVYSLGVLLYELLTGTTPFTEERFRQAAYDEICRIIRDEEPPRPSTRLSSTEALPSIAANRGLDPKRLPGLVRGELDWIVMKALEKDRGRRYETAVGLAGDLERYLRDEPVQACPPSRSYRFRKFVLRNEGPLVAATVIAVALLVASIVSVWQARRARQAEAMAKSSARDALALARANRLALQRETVARRQARRALEAMTNEVVERLLGRQVELSEDDRNFLKQALSFHEEFATANADGPEGRQGQAQGYFRVGQIRNRLGEVKDAESAFGRALTIRKSLVAEFPDRPEFRRELAQSHNNLSIILRQAGRLPDAETAIRDALALQKQMLAEFPDRPEYRHELAKSSMDFGNLLEDMGRLTEAEATLRDVVAMQKRLVADFPRRPEFRYELAKCQYNLANLLRNATARVSDVESDFRAVLATLEKSAADFPTRPDFRNELGRCHDGLGTFLFSIGRSREAEAALRAALTIHTRLAAEFPARTEFRYGLALTQLNLALLLREWNGPSRRDEAEKVLRDTEALLRRLVADFPARPDYRSALANSCEGLAMILRSRGQRELAEKACRDALELRKALVVEYPARQEFRRGLAQSYNGLGIVLLMGQQQISAAVSAFQNAIDLFEHLAEEFPSVPDYQRRIVGPLVNLARHHIDGRAFAAAAPFLERARRHLEVARRAGPDDHVYRQFYRIYLWAQTDCELGLGRYESAAEAAEQLAANGFDPANDGQYDSYNACCALCRCVGLAAKDDRLPRARRDELERVYADRAMALLRRATDKGFKNLAHMQKDTDLDVLRSRQDFRALMAGLSENMNK